MKKVVTFCLAFLLLISIAGCQSEKQGVGNPILFYYPRTEALYEYGAADGVIQSEARDPAGHRNNPRYLLTLYLRGPVDEHLVSPFPDQCQIEELSSSETELCVTLSSQFATLKEMDLTLACVSLAKTCFELTEAPYVRILCLTADGQTAIDELYTRQQLLTEVTPLPTESTR